MSANGGKLFNKQSELMNQDCLLSTESTKTWVSLTLCGGLLLPLKSSYMKIQSPKGDQKNKINKKK